MLSLGQVHCNLKLNIIATDEFPTMCSLTSAHFHRWSHVTTIDVLCHDDMITSELFVQKIWPITLTTLTAGSDAFTLEGQ